MKGLAESKLLAFRLATAADPVPWELLLDADPSRDLVAAYLPQSQLWLAELGGVVAGLYVLRQHDASLAEIMNVAVRPDLQGKGIGTALLRHADACARSVGVLRLRIATADASIGQQRLYKRVGFVEQFRVPDHFLKHYSDPIFEGSERCRDQVVLEKEVC